MKPLLRLLFLVILLYILYNLAAELSFNAEEATALDVEESRKAKIRVRQPLEDKKLSNDSPKKTFEPVRVPIVFENKKQVLIYSATKFFKMDVTTERFLGNCFSTMGFCRISENPADYEKADAVLFHSADYRQGNVPKNRRPGVPHVLWSLESQANDRFRPEPGLFAQYLKRWLLDVINWTMTPLKHSDIWYPYGHCEERPEAIELDLDEIWNMKTEKTAVWLASNCFTVNRRKDIINSLVSFGVDFKFKDPKFDPRRGPIKACIFPRSADLFGACGRPAPDCAGVHMQGYDCVKTLVRKYKFYFSIENSNCKDYVTEKFWAALGERYAVPIILERKKYEAVGAPPNSFIAIDDFKNLKEVAEHIKKVAANKEEYLKYHKWRNTHQVFPEHDDATGFCELCRVLQTPPYKKNSYHDIAKFQSPQEQCNQDYANRFF